MGTETPWTVWGTAWASWPPVCWTDSEALLTRWRTSFVVAVAVDVAAPASPSYADLAVPDTADRGVSGLCESSGSDLTSSVYGGGSDARGDP